MPAVGKHAAYLNVVGVVFLSGPTGLSSRVPSQEGPNEAGVEEIIDLSESEDSESVKGEDPLIKHIISVSKLYILSTILSKK